MKLYVNGQDIERLIVGDVEHGTVRIIEGGPEGYLSVIDEYVGEWKTLEAIYAVVGPGSATALRSILTILQTIHFVQGTPLFAIEKEVSEDDAITIARALDTTSSVETLIPVYQHSPRITVSQKDALGRL